MNKIFLFFAIVFTAVLMTIIVSIPESQAQKGTCYLQAEDQDVFVVIFDMDKDGNKGRKIWQGRINANQSVKITTPHGRFVYDYNAQPDIDQPLSGGTERWCNNEETVLVP